MISISFIIGNFNKEQGGAQQLLYDICSNLSDEEFDLEVYYMFGEGTFRPEFEELGVDVTNLAATSNYDLRSLLQLSHYLYKREPDIIHTNSPISGIWGRLAGHIAGVRNILSVEHNVHTAYKPSAKYANGITLPLSDAVVGVSDSVTQSLYSWEEALLPKTTKKKTIPNGVNVDRIESKFVGSERAIADHSPFSEDDTIIGTLGSLSEQKGFEYLIRSLPLIKRGNPEAKLLIIGGGPRRGELERLAERSSVSESIHFTGHVPDVYPLLPNFTVAAFPSLWEGFGLAPVETMVAEVPIVASRIDTFEEVIGDAGMLVPPKDPAALAEAITSLLDDPDKRRALGARGYDRATERFSITYTADAYADLYRDLVATDT